MANAITPSPAVPPTVAQVLKPAPPSLSGPVVTVAPVGPRNLTTDDKFVLVDANHDGLFDTIEIVLYDKAAVEKAANEAKFAPYYAALAAAKDAADRANAGRSAIEITAAENVAVAQAKVDWKGPVPPPSAVDKAAKVAADKAVADKAAVDAEVVRLKNKP